MWGAIYATALLIWFIRDTWNSTIYQFIVLLKMRNPWETPQQSKHGGAYACLCNIFLKKANSTSIWWVHWCLVFGPVPRWLLAAVFFVVVLLSTFELEARFVLIGSIVSTLTSVLVVRCKLDRFRVFRAMTIWVSHTTIVQRSIKSVPFIPILSSGGDENSFALFVPILAGDFITTHG